LTQLAAGRPGKRAQKKILDPNVPLHQQLFTLLEREIVDGLWVGRNDFPGEHELAETYGVSSITSRRVLDRLVADGLIDRGRGRRPRVTYVPMRTTQTAGSAIFPLEGRPYKYESRSVGTDIAVAEACDAFGVPHGSNLWQLSRLRRFNGRPHSVTHNAQLPSLGERHARKSLETLPMVSVLDKAGITIAELHRKIGVARPTLSAAASLGISVNDVTLVYTHILKAPKNETIEWLRIYMHPDEPSPIEVMDFQTGAWTTTIP
jgi:GntR family transcriptional regulator